MNSKRFVVLADLHSHPWAAFAKGDGLTNSRLQRSLVVLSDSLARARAEGIPWVFGGDLVHTAGLSLNVVLSGVVGVLKAYPDVPKIAVWGNHDARGTGGRITREQTVFSALEGTIENLVVLDGSSEYWRDEQGLLFYGAGYQPRADLVDFGPGEADVGIFHQTIRGSTTAGGFELTEGIERDKLLTACRFAVVGHIHHSQTFDAPKGQGILVPGSPEHHNFGDSGDHGWWVVTLPDDRELDPEVEFVSGGSPEFRTVDSPNDVRDDGNFYRVRTVPTGQALPEHATAIAPQPTTVEERALLRDVSEPEQILQVWMREVPPEEGVDLAACLTVGRQLLEAQDPVRMRPVRATSLRLSNFCSFEDQRFEIPEGVLLVTGKGRDYPSNGAGKTSLSGEALYWLVTGRNTKGLASDEVIRWGADSCFVSATLRNGTSETVVTRVRGKKHTLTVVTDGEPWEAASVDEMTTKLLRWLGLTPEIYQNLGYFSQEKLLLFSSATDGERKEVLADLIGLSAYQEASSAAGARVGELERERVGVAARLQAITEQLETDEAHLLEARARSERWEQEQSSEVKLRRERLAAVQTVATATVVVAGERAEATKARLGRWEGVYKETLEGSVPAVVETIRAQLVSKGEETLGRLRAGAEHFESASFPHGVDVARKQVALLVKTREKLGEHQATVETTQLAEQETAQRRNQLRGESAAADGEQTRAVAEIQRVESQLSAGVCPSCGQAIGDDHREACLTPVRLAHAGAATRAAAAGEALSRAAVLANDAQLAHTTARAARDQVQTLVTTLGQVETALVRLAEHGQQIREQEQQLAGLATVAEERAREAVDQRIAGFTSRTRGRVKRVDQHVERVEKEQRRTVEDAERLLREIEGRENPYASDVGTTEKRVEQHGEKIRTSQGEDERLRTTSALYEYWKKGFSKQGLQSLLVEEIASLFNRNRSEVFPVLTQGVYDVQFATLSRTRSGEAREKTEFLVFEHGRQIPYGALSGGQRRRVDLGIMLTLAKSVSEWMGVPGVLGILTLDEVCGFLDPAGAEGAAEVLSTLQQTIPTIFMVSHDDALQALIPDVIRVEQDEHGVSRVVA